jgi:hypothetical protein
VTCLVQPDGGHASAVGVVERLKAGDEDQTKYRHGVELPRELLGQDSSSLPAVSESEVDDDPV